ncbi:hypothetical protein VKT23_001600 [Stygiomarasmius scandens]|uniref:Uncharacterized protein n=1 Tax=Marasmiellus scandens TaxID=2682957 RepID=A0ABR1K3I3_9AGAR
MLDGIYNKKYNIIDLQKKYQNDHRPIYYRPPRRVLYIRTFSVGMALGAVGAVTGIYQLVAGKPSSS